MIGRAVRDVEAARALFVRTPASRGRWRDPADQFYGDRSAGVVDPFGNRWWFRTHVEDVSPEEAARRAKARKG